MVEFPREMVVWKLRAQWLMNRFDSRSKATVALLAEMLEFLNGDTTQDVLAHFCKPNCCKSDEDTFNKVATLLTSFFSKGFPVPLLYRMKHYAAASSFMRVGCCMHRLLPRILVEMNSSKPVDRPGSHLSEAIDVLLEGTGVNKNDADFQSLLTSLLNEDSNFAAQNGVRQSMVLRELSTKDFHQSSMIIDMMVQKMEHGTNFFLKRTEILHGLRYMSCSHPQQAQLRQESKAMFLQVLSGNLGRELVTDMSRVFGSALEEAMSMGLDGSQKQLNLLFQTVAFQMADVYRRFVFEFMGPPFSLLCLANADLSVLADHWCFLQQKFSRCRCCVDFELTTGLLEGYRNEVDNSFLSELQALLQEIAVWAPLTSDAVEIVHGQMQWSLTRRGAVHVRQGKRAVEHSLLSTVIKQNGWVSDVIHKLTMPARKLWAGIRKRVGKASSNHTSAQKEVSWLVIHCLIQCSSGQFSSTPSLRSFTNPLSIIVLQQQHHES